MNALFAPVSDVAKLCKLEREEANYEEAEKMVTVDPKLMFKYVSIRKKNLDGSYMRNADGSCVYEITSPLKLAFENLDTYMWKMYLETIIGYKKISYIKKLSKQIGRL